jgi:hypothetical protein
MPDEAVQEFISQTSSEISLVVNGVDRTPDFEDCISTSGYVEPEDPLLYSLESFEERRAIIDVTNGWAQCAREHGYPNVADVPVRAIRDSNVEPEVILPGSMTAESLRTLLEACPTFDPDAVEVKAGEDHVGGGAREQIAVDEAASPRIAVLPRQLDSDPTVSEFELEATAELSCILSEARRQFYSEHGGSDLGCGLAKRQDE